MNSSDEFAGETTTIAHRVDFVTCYVTQQGRGVAVVRQGEMEPEKLLAPPQEWGESWVWNVLEDGSGIYLRRT